MTTKPAAIKAAQERRANAKLRKYARRIPDNAALVNLLLSFADKPFRADLYRRLVPHLRFTPIKLEDMHHV